MNTKPAPIAIILHSRKFPLYLTTQFITKVLTPPAHLQDGKHTKPAPIAITRLTKPFLWSSDTAYLTERALIAE